MSGGGGGGGAWRGPSVGWLTLLSTDCTPGRRATVAMGLSRSCQPSSK